MFRESDLEAKEDKHKFRTVKFLEKRAPMKLASGKELELKWVLWAGSGLLKTFKHRGFLWPWK